MFAPKTLPRSLRQIVDQPPSCITQYSPHSRILLQFRQPIKHTISSRSAVTMSTDTTRYKLNRKFFPVASAEQYLHSQPCYFPQSLHSIKLRDTFLSTKPYFAASHALCPQYQYQNAFADKCIDTMLRVKDPKASVKYYEMLGMKQINKIENAKCQI